MYTAMWDLATDPVSQELINEFYAENRIISAVCHGPAALANVKLPNGEYLIAGQAVTGFSNSEEAAMGLTGVVPFSLETQLNTSSGGKYIKGDDWKSKVVVSGGGRLITGQNPQSAYGTGQATYDAIFGEETTRDES
jgi:putative intracellular protease/amidase